MVITFAAVDGESVVCVVVVPNLPYMLVLQHGDDVAQDPKQKLDFHQKVLKTPVQTAVNVIVQVGIVVVAMVVTIVVIAVVAVVVIVVVVIVVIVVVVAAVAVAVVVVIDSLTHAVTM